MIFCLGCFRPEWKIWSTWPPGGSSKYLVYRQVYTLSRLRILVFLCIKYGSFKWGPSKARPPLFSSIVLIYVCLHRIKGDLRRQRIPRCILENAGLFGTIKGSYRSELTLGRIWWCPWNVTFKEYLCCVRMPPLYFHITCMCPLGEMGRWANTDFYRKRNANKAVIM